MSEHWKTVWFWVIVILFFGFGVYVLNDIKNQIYFESWQTQYLKQLAVEKGYAWYNPTNGNFEILTNKVSRE